MPAGFSLTAFCTKQAVRRERCRAKIILSVRWPQQGGNRKFGYFADGLFRTVSTRSAVVASSLAFTYLVSHTQSARTLAYSTLCTTRVHVHVTPPSLMTRFAKCNRRGLRPCDYNNGCRMTHCYTTPRRHVGVLLRRPPRSLCTPIFLT